MQKLSHMRWIIKLTHDWDKVGKRPKEQGHCAAIE